LLALLLSVASRGTSLCVAALLWGRLRFFWLFIFLVIVFVIVAILVAVFISTLVLLNDAQVVLQG
jgi:hypothetical protein